MLANLQDFFQVYFWAFVWLLMDRIVYGRGEMVVGEMER